jgi:hypothetical protein
MNFTTSSPQSSILTIKVAAAQTGSSEGRMPNSRFPVVFAGILALPMIFARGFLSRSKEKMSLVAIFAICIVTTLLSGCKTVFYVISPTYQVVVQATGANLVKQTTVTLTVTQ